MKSQTCKTFSFLNYNLFHNYCNFFPLKMREEDVVSEKLNAQTEILNSGFLKLGRDSI